MDLSKFGVEVKDNTPKEITDKKLELDIIKMRIDYKGKEIERYLPWFLKYQLKTFDDLIITKEIKKILNFIEKRPKNKGILLYGPAGCGKTTTLNLIAKHYNFELFELNASDSRNKKSIEASVGDVIKQKSLFAKEKMILIDEVDGVSGNKDRGGVAQLVKLIKISKYPLTFAANEIEAPSIKTLKRACILIDFVNHSKELLEKIAIRIFKAEKIEFEQEELLTFIEERNSSDIRGFINDLQANVLNNKFVLDEENLGTRDYKRKIESLMNKIYFSYPEDSVKSSFNSDVKLDDLFLYLEENTPNAYTKRSLILAFNEISKADVFKGRIMKWQYWRFLVYVNFYLTFGVSTAKTNPKQLKIQKNTRILKKWIYGNKVNALRPRTKIEKKKNLPLKFIENLAKIYGTSVKSCRSQDLFYFAIQYRNDVEFRESMDKKFSIDDATKKALNNL